MTGEITLRGNGKFSSSAICRKSPPSRVCLVIHSSVLTFTPTVSPVGGIKEKVLGAHRAGIHTLILPHKNAKDVGADLPEAIRKECTFVYVRTIWEALEAAFGHEALWAGLRERGLPMVESRL